MAATSSSSSFQTHGSGYHARLSKSRTRNSVRPILKKLQPTGSEKNSLDLDRAWEDQEPSLGYVTTADDNRSSMYGTSGGANHRYTVGDLDDLFASSFSTAAAGSTAGRSARDANYGFARPTVVASSNNNNNTSPAGSLTPTISHAATTTTSAGSTSLGRPSHTRSASGASHASIATSVSRNGSFVHPFQQNPQTSTPPLLSYTNSRASIDAPRDYSPTINEDDADPAVGSSAGLGLDGDLDPLTLPLHATKTPPQSTPSQPGGNAYLRPSLAPRRQSGSQADSVPLQLREGGGRASGGSTPRLSGRSSSAAVAVNQGRLSDLQLDTSSPSLSILDDSPLQIDNASPHNSLALPSSVTASPSPMSPLRHSFDMNHFRLRSRSDADTGNRQEQVRQARRKFEEKEKAKEEKYAREQVRKRGDRAQAQLRKSSYTATGRASYSEATRPPTSRRSTGLSRRTMTSSVGSMTAGGLLIDDDDDDNQLPAQAEVENQNLEADPARAASRVDAVQFESTKKTRITAKHKTTGAWTSFVLWLRTRLLKLGRR